MPLGILRKMKTQREDAATAIRYRILLGESEISLNEFLDHKLKLHFTGRCFCIACGRSIKKTFQQGYCFPCTQKLAETDACVIKPELCHHHMGTCRDEHFAQSQCFVPHVVYLANCGSAKVGITRAHQKFTRWVDQGASQVLEFAVVPNRLVAGKLEVFLKSFVADRTNWRKMLSTDIPPLDLKQLKEDLKSKLGSEFLDFMAVSDVVEFAYPVIRFPQKISSHDLDKNPDLAGKLMGIKGQYLIFENVVINLRKYQGYEIEFTHESSELALTL